MIRVIAIAVIARPRDGALLVYDGVDELKQERYHRPLGGGVEFGETAEQAVRREMREEIDVELANVRLLGWLENLFTLDGKQGHQIVAVFAAELVDHAIYERDEIPFIDNNAPWTAMWVKRSAFRSAQNPAGPPLYPAGLAALLDRAL